MYSQMREAVVGFLRDESGPTATEYAVMFAIILLGALVGITTIGTKVNANFVAARAGW